MTENVKIETKPVEIEDVSYVWLYVSGLIILLIAGYFIIKTGFFGILSGKNRQEAVKNEEKVLINVTIEAEVVQLLPSQKTYFIKSLAGFTTLSYTAETIFTTLNEEKISSNLIKTNSKIRAIGKPNGKIFEANKVIILEGKVGSLVSPTPFKLPETGIIEE